MRLTSGYDVVQPSGQKIEFREARQVTLVRPAKMRIDVERDDGNKSLVLFDGNTIRSLTPIERPWPRHRGPGTSTER